MTDVLSLTAIFHSIITHIHNMHPYIYNITHFLTRPATAGIQREPYISHTLGVCVGNITLLSDSVKGS